MMTRVLPMLLLLFVSACCCRADEAKVEIVFRYPAAVTITPEGGSPTVVDVRRYLLDAVAERYGKELSTDAEKQAIVGQHIMEDLAEVVAEYIVRHARREAEEKATDVGIRLRKQVLPAVEFEVNEPPAPKP